jgi:hypothetical protein
VRQADASFPIASDNNFSDRVRGFRKHAMAETREKDGRFRKGISGNPSGATRLDRMIVFDLREAARRHCPEAIGIIAREMHNKDARIRLLACELMLERGYGKPLVQVDADVCHKFVRVPEVLDQKTWLETRGQGYGQPKPPDAPTTLTRDPLPDDEKPN